MGPRLAECMVEEDNNGNGNNDCEKPETLFSVGWSHGREQLTQGQPDFAKGSYYANPLTESLIQSLMEREDEATKEAYWKEQGMAHPECYADNVWPLKNCPNSNRRLWNWEKPWLKLEFYWLPCVMNIVDIFRAVLSPTACGFQIGETSQIQYDDGH